MESNASLLVSTSLDKEQLKEPSTLKNERKSEATNLLLPRSGRKTAHSHSLFRRGGEAGQEGLGSSVYRI